jgi:RNA polymerase sigma-70 factor (ECF subfamily)
VTEAELIASARAGSADAFGMLAEAYVTAIYRVAHGYTRSTVEAEDVVQETLLRAFLHLGTFKIDRPFKSWILTIARNTSFDVARRRKRDALLEWSFPAPAEPEDVVIARDDAERVRLALQTLPERYRRVLELHYFDNLRYRDISVVLGLPIGTIKTFISRAKRRLHDDLTLHEPPSAA